MPTRIETDGAPSFALPVVRAVAGVRDRIGEEREVILVCLDVRRCDVCEGLEWVRREHGSVVGYMRAIIILLWKEEDDDVRLSYY